MKHLILYALMNLLASSSYAALEVSYVSGGFTPKTYDNTFSIKLGYVGGELVPALIIGLSPKISGISRENFCTFSVAQIKNFGFTGVAEFLGEIKNKNVFVKAVSISGRTELDSHCEIVSITNLRGMHP